MKKQEETKGVLVEEVIEVLDITEEDIQLDNQETEHAVGVVTIGEKVASVIQIDHMIFKKMGISVDQVLTQQEIDLLLNAMSSGEIDQEIIEIEDKQAKVKSLRFSPTNKAVERVRQYPAHDLRGFLEDEQQHAFYPTADQCFFAVGSYRTSRL